MSDNYTGRVQFAALDLSTHTSLNGTRTPRHRSTLPYGPILMKSNQTAKRGRRSSFSDYPADSLRRSRHSTTESQNRAEHMSLAHSDSSSYGTDKATVDSLRRSRRANTQFQNVAQAGGISFAPVASSYRTGKVNRSNTNTGSSAPSLIHSYAPRASPYNRGVAAHPSTWFPVSQGGWSLINGIPVWVPSAMAVVPPSRSPFAARRAPLQPIGVPSTFFPGVPVTSAVSTSFIPHSKFHYDLSVCPLKWSVTNLPSTAKSQNCTLNFWENLGRWAKEPAYPRANHLIIKYDHNSPNLTRWQTHWGKIEVERRLSVEITVEDVLQAIHSYFQVPMSTDEYECLPLLERNMVFTSRFRRMGGTSNPLSHTLRLDILEGQLEFRGLTFGSEDEHGTVMAWLNLGPSASWMKWPS